jgi:murein DD-endopeptidase MepM/ murein hydrolase activator NlpD
MLQLYFAVKPNLGLPLDMTGKTVGAGINQLFGQNPDYYAKFGWKGHNGIDFTAPHATPLYAPCDGEAFYATDSHGGDGIYIRTPSSEAGQQYNVILWHLIGKDDPVYHPLIPTDGTSIAVTVGALLGYTDNTGAPYESSGDHLHFGLVPTDGEDHELDPNNGYGGCIDPMPFFTGTFAQDADTEAQAVQNSQTIVSAVAKDTVNTPSLRDQILSEVEAILKKYI